MTDKHFPGFPEESICFLRDLEQNNNRDWFEANRDRYERYYLDPASRFVTTLGAELQRLSPGIHYDSRANGQGSIMRIHRDTRFSKDKSPYNVSLRLLFWEGSGKKLECPAFFLRVAPEGINLYAGMYLFPKPFLEAFRASVLDETTGNELAGIVSALNASAPYRVDGERYKRVPQGYEADHPRAELLKYKGLHAEAVDLDPGMIHAAEFASTCLEHCQKMLPLHSWLVRIGSK